MKRVQKLVLALSASAVLALGAVSPAVAIPPENRGTATACAALAGAPEEAARTAREVLDCPAP